MTSRERLLAVMHGDVPDCVPCCPDISNMVPCRLTGKPFWDIYAHQDPPLWKAHIDALKYYDIDGGFEVYAFGPVDPVSGHRAACQERVVQRRDDGSFVTRHYWPNDDRWAPSVRVYTIDNPPASNVSPSKVGVPEVPTEWEPLTGVKDWPEGLDLWLQIREYMGDQGVIGLPSGASTCMIGSVEAVYAYHDNPKPFLDRIDQIKDSVSRRMKQIEAMPIKPDMLFCGGSGSLIWQSPQMFRDLSLPILKHVTRLASEIGIPTHVHSCGPEAELVRMGAEESDLTIIDPLEIPPMGDCDLADLKKRYGKKIVLKGNLHTTETMLRGSVEDVVRASRRAIDDAAEGGGFILSTGDQCGRDTPDENIRAMVETARSYGKY